MNSMVRAILLILLSILILFNAADRHAWTAQPALAQDSSKNRRPPLQRQKTAPTDEEDKPTGQTSIAVSVDLVSLQVLVTDMKGNVITGLKPENFTIYEDSVKQEITNFSPIEAGITVVMLVEYSKQISYFIDDVWNAMYGFANSLRKGDWIAVIAYDMYTKILCDFTQDHQKIRDTLNLFRYPAYRESNVSDAVIEALDRTQELEGKVAVLLISTGLDTFSRHTYDEALKKCKEASASIYAISVGQHYRIRAEAAGAISNEGNLDLLMGDNRLRSFADVTGGAAYFPRFETELPAICSNISQLLRNQYSIAYASTNPNKDGKFRKIKVEVNTDMMDKGKPLKLKASTRKGYIAKP